MNSLVGVASIVGLLLSPPSQGAHHAGDAAQVGDPTVQVGDPTVQVGDPTAQVGDPAAQVGDRNSRRADDVGEASQAVELARRARDAGDYAEALRYYARALELRPAAALHYNIAVCHHRLMMEAPTGDAGAQAHRRAAISAYESYLHADPDADDRGMVEAHIRTLQEELAPPPRSPAENGWEPPTWEDAVSLDAPSPPRLDPPPQPLAPPRSAPADPSGLRDFPRGRVRLHGVLALAGLQERRKNERVQSIPEIGLLLGVAGLFGRRRGASLGGELQWTAQPRQHATQHQLMGWHLVVEAGYGVRLGPRRRFEVRFTGLLGARGQRLLSRGPTPLDCALDRRGLIDRRYGARVGGRVSLQMLLGSRARHEVGLLLTPIGTIYGNGAAAFECDDTPWQQLGLGSLEFEWGTSVGYGTRF